MQTWPPMVLPMLGPRCFRVSSRERQVLEKLKSTIGSIDLEQPGSSEHCCSAC